MPVITGNYELVNAGGPIDHNGIRRGANFTTDDGSCCQCNTAVVSPDGADFAIEAKFAKYTVGANSGAWAAVVCLGASNSSLNINDSLLAVLREGTSSAGYLELIHVDSGGTRTVLVSVNVGTLATNSPGVLTQLSVQRVSGNVTVTLNNATDIFSVVINAATATAAIPSGLLTSGHNYFGFYLVRPGTDTAFYLSRYIATWTTGASAAVITDTVSRLILVGA